MNKVNTFPKLKKKYGFEKITSNTQPLDNNEGDVFLISYKSPKYILEKKLYDWKDLSKPLTREYILYTSEYEKILSTDNISSLVFYLEGQD